DVSIVSSDHTGDLTNYGTFEATSDGVVDVQVDVDNMAGSYDGIVDGRDGSIVFSARTFRFWSGTLYDVQFGGATLAVSDLYSSSHTAEDLSFTGGTLNGTGTLSLTGDASWSAGGMANAGILRITAGATLAFANSSALTIDAHTLENYGTITWSGSGDLTLTNGASL